MAGREDQPPVRLRLSGDYARVLIEVWDADPQPPEDPGADGLPDLEAEGGRRLFLVAALSSRWNWHLTRQPAGKVVWCEFEDDQPETAAGHGSAGHLLLPGQVPGAVQIPARWRFAAGLIICHWDQPVGQLRTTPQSRRGVRLPAW